MEKGFYHPDRGYWQTTGNPPPHILSKYPEGTIEIPLRPQGAFDWDGSQWVQLPPNIDALATQARAERDIRLTASDWTMISDAPVDQSAWATYRQALRDVPAQAGFPENIVWPTRPEVT